MKQVFRALLALGLSLLAAWALAVQGSVGPYRVDLRTDPPVIPVGKATLSLKVMDASGKPVSGATVKVLAQMPGMPMGEREETATPGGQPGTYIAPAVFAMEGGYYATVTISGPQGSATGKISLSTGENTSGAGGGLPWVAILAGLFVLAAVVLIAVRMRKTGQGFNLKGVFSAGTILSLVILAGALAVAVWAVNTQRRPGSMTPIEAQVMSMDTPAPAGTLPVTLVKVQRQPFVQSVTYTGQVVGYVEQDVVPRVTGTIVWMPFYAGDKVKKGQLLARLDTSQLDPMVSEKAAGVNAAQQGVSVASMEYQQALNGVTQAQAEVSTAQGAVDEARAMLDAAKQERGSSQAGVDSAQANVQAMEAALTSTQADRTYQLQDLAREKDLFAKNAISQDEMQRSQADADKASASVARARQDVVSAQAGVAAARSALKKTDADIAAAQKRVQQAQAQLRAKQAMVKTAQSAASAAKGKIGQSEAGVAQASAALQGAATERGYAELRAEVDGVVTQRLISPGVVVSPGQAVLKVAQISPIRLQANVPEADLTRIRVGAMVKVTRRDVHEDPIMATVTSISPSLDPSSRTGIVEAVYPNAQSHFLPGQFVSMQIDVGTPSPSIVVPSTAVQTDGDTPYVWLAQPTGGAYSVSRQDVEIGGTSGDVTAIKSGLSDGQEVVSSAPDGLAAGAKVADVSAPTADASPGAATVEVTDTGYSPPSIDVPAGKPFEITFIRRAAQTCATQVIFPDLGIRKDLPLNQPVKVEIPAQPAGKQLNFTCPMNMLKGKAVAQ